MPILEGVKKKIFLNAGHHNTDPGAISLVERDEVKKIRDEVTPLLIKYGFEVFVIPDNLTLPQSIAEVNKYAKALNDGLAVDIHLNSSSDKTVSGSEGYHGTSERSINVAKSMSRNVALALSIPDRGARPDTQTAVGSLGWIRQTSCLATLIEVGYITNTTDMKALTSEGGYKRAAQGIVNALLELYGVPHINPLEEKVKEAILESKGVTKTLEELLELIKTK